VEAKVQRERRERELKRKGKTHRIAQLHNLEIGLVPQIINLSPIDRYTAPRLGITEPNLSLDAARRSDALLILRIEEEDLLRFVKVGNVTLAIDAATEVARAGAVAGAT
jgi:hypothetical protein